MAAGALPGAYGGSALVEHVLLVTTKRVIFGTANPISIIFEFPVERMARVELPKPTNRLILWTWHRVPRVLSPFLIVETGARPNGIAEWTIEGADPRQLRAAFFHLLSLAQQHERAPYPTPEELYAEPDDGPLLLEEGRAGVGTALAMTHDGRAAAGGGGGHAGGGAADGAGALPLTPPYTRDAAGAPRPGNARRAAVQRPMLA